MKKDMVLEGSRGRGFWKRILEGDLERGAWKKALKVHPWVWDAKIPPSLERGAWKKALKKKRNALSAMRRGISGAFLMILFQNPTPDACRSDR